MSHSHTASATLCKVKSGNLLSERVMARACVYKARIEDDCDKRQGDMKRKRIVSVSSL